MDNTILCRARILQDINFVDLQYFGVLLEQVLYFDFTKPLTSLIYNSLPWLFVSFSSFSSFSVHEEHPHWPYRKKKKINETDVLKSLKETAV